MWWVMKRTPLQRILTLNGIVLFVGMCALGGALIFGSLVGQIVCGLIVLTAVAYLVVAWRRERELFPEGEGADDEPLSPSPEGAMKKLLFDDYQSRDGKYEVKEIEDDPKVVPSTRSARPAPVTLKPETMRELEILDFFDLDADVSYTDVEPKAEFHTLVNKVLLVLKDVLFAHSVAFFWANHDKQQMVIEAMTSSSENFMKEKRFPIEDDIASQVAKTGKAQMFGRVNASSESSIARYYEQPEGVQSVLCVPVFFMDGTKDIRPVGVIVADSKAEDAFGAETLVLLGRFTKLVSSLVKSYTDKYDLLLDSELLSSIRRMQDRLKSSPSEQTVLSALADEANRLASWDFLSVAMFAEDRHGWMIQKVMNKADQPYVAVESLIDIEGSVIGEVITSNTVEMVDDLEGESRCRYFAGESVESQGSLLCVPISSFNRCYGALALESRKKSNFSGSEVETIYRLVENAASSLEVLYMNALVKEHVAIDQLTGSLTPKHFGRKIEEEVLRAEEFGADLSCVSVAVDGLVEHRARYGSEGADAILNTVAKILRAHMRPYDALGRLDGDRLGVLLVNTAGSEAYLWAEKMRKLISSQVVTAGSKTTSVTVSAGVCGLTEGMVSTELLSGTSQVLGKAMEHGGNLVRVF